MAQDAIRTLVWNEHIHERENETVAKVYPEGIHQTVAAALRAMVDGEGGRPLQVETATLSDPEHGLSAERLARTDVLLWWGHKAHGDVDDKVVDAICARVWQGMGFIALHSAHFSKPFRRLMGSPCALRWREAGERERLWVINPTHPIVEGIGPCIELANTEMYGEPFSVPEPDETVLVSWFEGGEVFRSGMTWHRGAGRIFYLRPGHEIYPIYFEPNIQRVLRNAVRWAHSPRSWVGVDDAPNVPVEEAREPLVARGAALHAPGEEGYR
ncbi:MAG: ThuA domain-containing protein [Pseudomonadota bacterium]